MIRPATPHDIPRLVELGQLLHDTSKYADIRYIPEKVSETLRAVMGGAGVVYVAERGGHVIGGLVGGVTELWFSNEKTAFDYTLFIDPASRHGITAAKLIAAFVEWAKLSGARWVEMGITTGVNVEGTSRLYRRLGFVDAGILFRLEV